MGQQILFPGDAATLEKWQLKGPVPSQVRSFGKFPNVHEWLPGDLLLISHFSAGWVAGGITRAQQRGGYDEEDARWHHAAVYMGENTLLEATLSGVRYTSVYEYVGNYVLRVRRDPNLTDQERMRLAIRAGFWIGSRYNFLGIALLAKMSFSGFWKIAEPACGGTVRP